MDGQVIPLVAGVDVLPFASLAHVGIEGGAHDGAGAPHWRESGAEVVKLVLESARPSYRCSGSRWRRRSCCRRRTCVMPGRSAPSDPRGDPGTGGQERSPRSMRGRVAFPISATVSSWHLLG